MTRLHAEIAAIVTFFTKLPAALTGISANELAAIDLALASRFAAIAGVLVGLAGAVAIVVLAALGLPAPAAVIAGILAMLVLTGGLHEDGLADTADALGATAPERRLAIMRDSRIGTFGAVALWASLSLRVALLVTILQAGTGHIFAALVAAHAVSRAAALYLPYRLPPARPDGASVAFGRPDTATFRQGLLIAATIGFLSVWAATGLAAAVSAIALAWTAVLCMARLARKGFGGQTGDLIGATQQISEIVVLALIAIYV